MVFPKKLADRQKDRNAALKQQKDLLSRIVPHGKAGSVKPAAPVAAAPSKPAHAKPKAATVRMSGEPVLKLTVDGSKERQYLSPTLRECVDLYLRAAQCGTRECALLWPGSLKCLPLIHALATIERWAQGYKRGLRALHYPATAATFFPLDTVFVNRGDITLLNSMWQELAEPKQEVPKESCPDKDLMLFALASKFKDEEIQPCLNELLPHFLLKSGDAKEVASLNYGSVYLSHVVTKLAKRRQKKDLQQSTFPQLGAANRAPDAVFALSYQMTKAQLETALKELHTLGKIDVVLVDATRIAFERIDKFQNRLAVFVNMVGKVLGPDGPGILIVTNDPRQMTYVRAALTRELKDSDIPVRFGATHGMCHRGPRIDLGLRASDAEPAIVLDEANITVSITDRESAKLITEAYRISKEKSVPPEINDVLANASHFVSRMANLPSSADLLHEYMDDSMADDTQRRSFDWIAQRNKLKKLLRDMEVAVRVRTEKWMDQTTALLQRQEEGTPLARIMVDRIKARAATEGGVLVVVRSRFYADLAQEYFRRTPDCEALHGRVQFIAIRLLEEKLKVSGPMHVIACALSPDLLRWAITTPTLPGTVDFLLTQETAQGANYALEPILSIPVFKPYFHRVKALYEPIKGAKGALNAVLPDFDYQAPAFSLTTDHPPTNGNDKGPTDYVEIAIEDGRRIHRGRGARVYIYNPVAKEASDLGFVPDDAANITRGDHIFVMSEEMRDEVEATFAAAGVKFDEASRYEDLLRYYHASVLAKVKEKFSINTAEAARMISDAMGKANIGPKVLQNVRYWISLKHAAETPFGELMPQAPRHYATFKVFMEVLGFDAKETTIFWDHAVKRVRGTRISDGVNLGDHYERVLLDSGGASAYDRLTPEVLNTLRASALDNVFEVTAVSLHRTN
jgi:hypothetical protein